MPFLFYWGVARVHLFACVDNNWSSIFHESDTNNVSCAKFIQTVVITCAIQELTLLPAYILHATYIALPTPLCHSMWRRTKDDYHPFKDIWIHS